MVHLFNKDLRGSQSKKCRPTTHSSEVSVGSMQNYHNHRDWVSVKGGLSFCCPGLWRPSASHPHPQKKSPLHFSRCLQIPGQMKPFLWGATQGHSSSGGHNNPFHRGLALKFHRWWEERQTLDPPSSLRRNASGWGGERFSLGMIRPGK